VESSVPPGQIVVLNGVPRSGKSSIAAAIQERDGVWMNVGVDVSRAMTPPRYQPGIGLRPGEQRHSAAHVVPVLYAALYDSIAAHSRLGLNVVVDVGHHVVEILSDCARRLAGLPVIFVGVRCPLEVIIERRNASAAGSYATASEGESIPLPILRWQEEVHAHGIYDLEVDTSVASPDDCADAILYRLRTGPAPTAFEHLAAF
jgi:chloramphenicol 3-O phosphotransferase